MSQKEAKLCPRAAPTQAALTTAAPASRCKIALYSHETMGLGHIRRNLLIAGSFARAGLNATTLLLAGAREASAFAVPPGVDCLALPAIHKDGDGHYASRSLDVPFGELIALRARVIEAALEAFAPDVLIVDKVPRGVGQELEPALRALRRQGRARCVLGLRDVLDDPDVVRAEWAREANEAAVREFYDAVWIYGDPQVYDLVADCGFGPELARKASYCGYLDRRAQPAEDSPRSLAGQALDGAGADAISLDGSSAHSATPDLLASLGLPPGELVLCAVGGGQDGASLAEAFARATLPPGTNGVLVTGPFMAPDLRRRLHLQAASNPRLRVLEFVTEPEHLLGRADRVICMGGYNTVCEVLAFGKPALLVPRVRPRREQWIRAEQLRALGLLDVLHPDHASAQALSQWLARPSTQSVGARSCLDFNGLGRLPVLLRELLASPRPEARSGRAAPGPAERALASRPRASRRAEAAL